MKRFIYFVATVMAALSLSSCSDDDWDYDKSLEHEYFITPKLWGYDKPGAASGVGSNNCVFYDVNQGETVAVPMEFHSAFDRNYDVTTYYWTAPKPDGEKYIDKLYKYTNDDLIAYEGPELVRGVDYEVVDAKGNVLTPGADGAFKLEWPHALAGVQNIYIKALPGGKKGSFNVQTVSPEAPTPSASEVSTTYQYETKQFAVRIVSYNYRVTINVR